MSGVVVYSSSAGGIAVQKNTTALVNLLNAKKVAHTVVYLDLDGTNKEEVWSKSQKKGVYPLLFSKGNFIGTYEDIEKLNEEEKLEDVL